MDIRLIKLCEKLHPERIAEINISMLQTEIQDTSDEIIKNIIVLLLKKTKTLNPINSSILYCLGITDQKPNGYVVRKGGSNPDVDMDFCEIKRHLVVDYIKRKYGSDRVANIGTYGSMKAKAAIRDVARTLNIPYNIADNLSKLTLEPIAGKVQPLSVCYEKVPQLKRYREGEASDQRTILEWAEQLENRLKSYGTHASGILISENPVYETVPLYVGKDGAATTQFEMNTVEECGLIKFDLLGLRALTTIDRCIKTISKNYNIHINPLEVPIDDLPTYQMLQSGDVDGVFQLETSSGMRDLLVQVRPSKLDDLALLVAIYRPGPLASPMLQHYLRVRAGQAEPQYIIPELAPILGNTDGMLIYQEQVLEICKQLAGYTLGEADIMRRVIGKKKEKEMVEQHTKFVSGMVANGFKSSDAEQIFDDIKSFSEYGFNRAHAACYGYISYQMAYLKCHYPIEFMCACLVSDSDESDKIIQYISYCHEKGIKILGPSVNESQYDFSIVEKGSARFIRFGLGAIKNLGKPVNEIIQEREWNGPYTDILNFADRVDLSKVNKLKIQSLVLSGAFDDISDTNRMSLLNTTETILEYRNEARAYLSKQETYEKRMQQFNARQAEIETWNALTKEERQGRKKPPALKLPTPPEKPLDPTIMECQEMLIQDILQWERELLGFFITSHPLSVIQEKSKNSIKLLKEKVSNGNIENKFKCNLLAIPNLIKIITTKKNKKKMAYVTLEDKTGTIQAVAMPNMYEKFEHLIDTKIPALYTVEVEVTEGDVEKIPKLIINQVHMLKSVQEFRKRPIVLNVKTDKLLSVSNMIKNHLGAGSTVELNATGQCGQAWHLGRYQCAGDRAALEKGLKAFT